MVSNKAPVKGKKMSHYTLENIEKVAKEEGVSVLYVLTNLQAWAAEAHDNDALERLCRIKSDIIGL